MNKCIYLFLLSLSGHSIVSFADEPVNYGYDKVNNVIYAQKNGKKGLLNFTEDYTGNPSYLFDFFSDSPAIIADSRSLHDSTVYATLRYSNNKFFINCLYTNIKSKKNGIIVKEGFCGLDNTPAEKYMDFIDEKIGKIEDNMDAYDTSLILNEKIKYLPIVIYNSTDKLIYKLYNNKKALFDDNYSIVVANKHNKCETFVNSPWVIFNKAFSKIEIMNEKKSNGKLELIKATPSESGGNECSSYPVINIVSPRSYFYDSSYRVKKSYLIKGDEVSLLSISADGKWCKARYINNKNKSMDSNMLCSDLSI